MRARRSHSVVTRRSSEVSFRGAVLAVVRPRFPRPCAGREFGRRLFRRVPLVLRYPGGWEGVLPASPISGTQNSGVMTQERETARVAGGFARVGSGSIGVTFLLRIVFSAPMLPLSCLVVAHVQVTRRVIGTPQRPFSRRSRMS